MWLEGRNKSRTFTFRMKSFIRIHVEDNVLTYLFVLCS